MSAPTTRDRIVAAAAALLTEGGREAVSTRAVSAAAGVQAPAIYRIFGDKQGLLDAVASHGFATYLAGKAALPHSDDPVEDLRARHRRPGHGEPGGRAAGRPARHDRPDPQRARPPRRMARPDRGSRLGMTVGAYLDAVVARLRSLLGDRLTGVYPAGSLAFDAYRPGRSDVDLVAVADRPTPAEVAAIVAGLSHDALPCPAAGLEFVLDDRTTLAR